MDNIIIEYAPLIVIALVFLLRNKIFITPDQMSNAVLQVKDEILKEIEGKYATLEFAKNIREDITEIKEQLKTISDFLMTGR